MHKFIAIMILVGITITAADMIPVNPLWVHDGDTFRATVLDRAVLDCRIWGIDAPELDQPWGRVARHSLIALVHLRNVQVRQVSKSYNRTVVQVKRHDVDIALALLKMGLAWVTVEYDPPPEYIKAEAEARASKRGLWSEKKPIPPWEWRKEKRGKRPEK